MTYISALDMPGSLDKPGSRETPGHRYGLGQVVRSELTKLASLRSTLWTLIVTVIGTIGVTILATNGARHQGQFRGFDPTNQSMTGLALGTLAIGVFGVLSITGEYGTGTIRSSLAAAPRRPLLLLAKVLVIGSIALALGEALVFACFGVGQAVLSGAAPTASLGQPGVLRALVLSGACLALLGLMALGLGVIIRHTAGAVAGFVGITFLLPLLLQKMPGTPSRFTPVGILANSVSTVRPESGQLSPTTGFLLMILYSAVILGLGAVLIARRDA